MSKELETKYVAYTWSDRYIPGSLPGDNLTRRLFTVLPPLTVGPASNQRIGNSIHPVKLRVTAQYFFNGDGVQGGQDINGVGKSGLYEVRQFCLTSKDIKANRAWTSTVATDRQPRMLEVGDGTTINPDSASAWNMTYKISDENFTPIKGCKRFIMGKNAGVINGGSLDPLTTARAQDTLHFSIKCPKTFHYEEDVTDNYPTNFCPLFGAHAGLITNSLSTTYDGLLGVIPGNTNSIPLHPIIRSNVRVELWFKDA